ncbi:hypothetical protein AAFC00_002027 [Neodothiora populina]|uniref:BHLH domain-containing protein n=1 Tax=Neodothiora populina TaxID=2781224 RepID=A0ABR3PG39_9PEZI
MAESNHAQQPSSHPNPFGYTIGPPEADLSQLRGQPILDDVLQTGLDQFFDSPDNNATTLLQNPAVTSYLDNPNFPFTFDANAPWGYHEPSMTNDSSHPYLQAYDSSLRQTQDNGDNLHVSSYDNHNPSTISMQQPPQDVLSGFGIEEDAPDDVLKAATKLFEYRSQKQAANTPLQRPALPSHNSVQEHLSSHEYRPPQSSHMRMPAPLQDYSTSQYNQSNGHFRTSIDSNAAYSPPANPSYMPARNSYSSQQPYQFGSDSNFNPNGYNGPYQGATDQHHMDFIRGIARYPGESGVPSAASSHPQSPVTSRQDGQFSTTQLYPYQVVKQKASAAAGATYRERPSPRKRRRTASGVAVDEPAPYAPRPEASPTVGNSNNASSPDVNGQSPGVASPSSADSVADGDDAPAAIVNTKNSLKRRKSSAADRSLRQQDSTDAAADAAAAAARKNLTEEQKRENHIKSEQKRRNIIKDGYKNLNDLVPNLKQGGFSKSATLTETVRELETLQAANEVAKQLVMRRLNLSKDELTALMDEA